MKANDTNISIRTSKRFAAWFRVRAKQENFTASRLGFEIIQQWINRGSPMLTEGMRKAPTAWDPTIDWERMEKQRPDTLTPLPAGHSASPHRR